MISDKNHVQRCSGFRDAAFVCPGDCRPGARAPANEILVKFAVDADQSTSRVNR
ncbi:hypothetical protein C7S16_5707 [Burkholderia thailandensis]|uniref:Uncharacterized protein n=1 Tax=Burkholderia thailandensis TaxID=57975 RepID=A0AAW9CMT3_BURTH|nr:hypothetical protein [Burkholderia thailandensis]MDW9252173.1 hypothetical protein [Burkholderia thailandensis]